MADVPTYAASRDVFSRSATRVGVCGRRNHRLACVAEGVDAGVVFAGWPDFARTTLPTPNTFALGVKPSLKRVL